jgi:hypothetical protein
VDGGLLQLWRSVLARSSAANTPQRTHRRRHPRMVSSCKGTTVAQPRQSLTLLMRRPRRCIAIGIGCNGMVRPRRNYGLGDNDFGSYHFHRAAAGGGGGRPSSGSEPGGSAGAAESGSEATAAPPEAAAESVHFAGNFDGDRTCNNRPAPPWVDPGDEDSVAVQTAVHTLFQSLALRGGPFQGCGVLTVPGRDETAWLQVRELTEPASCCNYSH